MTKLNKEQLKKLYDYGGTLSPKDWANMIDSVVPPSDGKYTIVKTTYESARDLYHKGQMEYGVKYEFDYIHHNYCAESVLYMPNLQVYIDNNGNLKANYTVPIFDDDTLLIETAQLKGYEVQIPAYDRSFTADFKFDYFITCGLKDSFNESYIYEIDVKKTITLNYYWEGSYHKDFNNFINQLNSLGIPYTYNIDNSDEFSINLDITFSDCNLTQIFNYDADQYYDAIWYGKYVILINSDSSYIDIIIQDINPLHLALIKNIEYVDGCFHKILVDSYIIPTGDIPIYIYLLGEIYKIPTDSYISINSEYTVYALSSIGSDYGIYNTDLDTFISVITERYELEGYVSDGFLLCINSNWITLSDINEI